MISQRLIFSLDEYYAFGKEQPSDPGRSDPSHKPDEHPIREPEQPSKHEIESAKHLINFLI